MSGDTRTLEKVRDNILYSDELTTGDTINFYNKWAEKYNQDVAMLDYRAGSIAADTVSTYFTGDREAALVLDVACGTGLVATQMKKRGFVHFVGLDGSEGMLQIAKSTELYEDVRQCMLGDEELPVQWDTFDIAVIAGGLSVSHVPISVVREMCKTTKAGGLICMTTRNVRDNVGYKASLEEELRLLEEEGLLSRVHVTEVEELQLVVSTHEEGYMSGAVYLYRVSEPLSR